MDCSLEVSLYSFLPYKLIEYSASFKIHAFFISHLLFLIFLLSILWQFLIYSSFLFLFFLAGRSNSHNVSKKRRSINKQVTFDSTKFKLKYVLGSGSFGVVTYAEYLDGNCDINNGSYALKSISKADVVETGKFFPRSVLPSKSHTLYQLLSMSICSLFQLSSIFLFSYYSHCISTLNEHTPCFAL